MTDKTASPDTSAPPGARDLPPRIRLGVAQALARLQIVRGDQHPGHRPGLHDGGGGRTTGLV